ncbi:MAG: pyridoxal phosphate-dependent aminotransferase [Anaerolineales bacterium]|nr:pyridoxal phosphate-dependent aminotransferase [Anaerolineales bacterium]
MPTPDPLALFRLKPIRAARVSEISEATAAAPVPPEERINFHIGNPLQDERLISLFFRVAVGADYRRQDLADVDALCEHLSARSEDRPKLEFLHRLIQKSSPYAPRGGYHRKNPHPLVETFARWLENQPEPLRYNLNDPAGKREIILASGGVLETLRVLLTALSGFLQVTPARIFSYRLSLPPAYLHIPRLQFQTLPEDETAARTALESALEATPQQPTFLLIGAPLSEDARRKLRQLSIIRPLFFIEVNDAPNQHSLAREARLVQRVIRLLTPGIFHPRLASLSTVFVIGNADLLAVMETVHFALKGTPSASEIEFLHYLLENGFAKTKSASATLLEPDWPEELQAERAPAAALTGLAVRAGKRLDGLLQARFQVAARMAGSLASRVEHVAQILQTHWDSAQIDEFADTDSLTLLEELTANVDNPAWYARLERSFLSVFTRHQPQYRPEACLVTSGSSRTALGLLGFHCGLTDVVFPDLSWTYEQCFPNAYAVPLTDDLALDVDAMIAKLDSLCRADPTWPERGAIAINNPHNATGRIFAEADIRRLMTWCLERGIYVVDDLAYQNVAPVNDLPLIKTARQVADDLVQEGIITAEQADRVISVHSMSKTDCLAGARLSVVEIRPAALRARFRAVNDRIAPNLAAIFMTYLFYRGPREAARAYWRLRNAIFKERTEALVTASENLPAERNPFGLKIIPPTGSMYPLLQVSRLPGGLSLDWLASALARRGIGLLPLASFARTEAGFDAGRSTFRLTLGGVDGAEIMRHKARRLLIDLNRLIEEEDARYNRKALKFSRVPSPSPEGAGERSAAWRILAAQITRQFEQRTAWKPLDSLPGIDSERLRMEFLNSYLPERLERFGQRLKERALISDELVRKAAADGDWLTERLEREFMKDSLARRQAAFRQRTHDRTVHPTQTFSLQAELVIEKMHRALIAGQMPVPGLVQQAAYELLREFAGLNISINSELEAAEILTDFDSLTAAEAYTELFGESRLPVFLSFWSDWDGSNRPSGQGHRLAAAAVMENVRRMAEILTLLRRADPQAPIAPDLLAEIERLPEHSARFTQLLNEITQLTHQLEQRYRGFLPYSLNATPLERLAARLRLRRDPAEVLWQHNDRYEKKMLELRARRRVMLEDWFALNKRLRKQLHALIPRILAARESQPLLRAVAGYHDILQRIVITPRIHQGMITSREQFAIETTAFNMQEINAIAGKYGNPGLTLALQISLSTRPEALIALDRKMNTQFERFRREYPESDLPRIWLIPLFEDIEAVEGIPDYLDKIWDYAGQSRHTDQTPQSRFSDILAEVFIAGSDLSQQISQPHSAFQYVKAKYRVHTWLAEHGLVDAIRIKLGSGEPMQRQGGYYAPVSGQPAFPAAERHRKRLAKHLPPPALRSTAYAVTPLQGVFLGGDLRTLQSNISEQMRFLSVRDLANLLYHLREAQQAHRQHLIRAAETLTESRLGVKGRGAQEMERLTMGLTEPLYEGFLTELTEHFRQILYGRPEDVFGLHIVSYFIGRTIPQLRDRPTSRRRAAAGLDRGQQIVASVAEMIPLSKQGSMLRAISHNQAQTAILGVNQLTTGLFRALEYYAQKALPEAEREGLIAERILPRLPVYDILHTLRLYQDWRGEILRRIETAFPAGHPTFVALREDHDAMLRYLPLFQQELLRRHGLNVSDFFQNGVFIPDLLPALRPDLAVLLQADLFNTDLERMLAGGNGKLDSTWLAETRRLLSLPEQVRAWRAAIWDLMGDSIYQRVQSFTELAAALHAFSSSRASASVRPASGGGRLPSALSAFLRSARVDDEMRQFLVGAMEQLSQITESSIEVPVSIIRAIKDVERIAQIEEAALPPHKQAVLRFCVLQISRLAGENG